jgi:ribosomal protein L32
MTRATALALVLLASCTKHTSPEPEPIVKRRFVNGRCTVEQDCSTQFSSAIEAHGIRCSGAEGSVKNGRDVWRTSCEGTEQQWTRAESTIDRLEAERIAQEVLDRYFAITDRSGTEVCQELGEAVHPHRVGMNCFPGESPAGVHIDCAATRQAWRYVEPTIARLEAEGVMRETFGPIGE